MHTPTPPSPLPSVHHTPPESNKKDERNSKGAVVAVAPLPNSRADQSYSRLPFPFLFSFSFFSSSPSPSPSLVRTYAFMMCASAQQKQKCDGPAGKRGGGDSRSSPHGLLSSVCLAYSQDAREFVLS